MRNVVSAAMSCRRCRCRAIYAGPLDVSRTAQCAECGHALVEDHLLVVKGRADPTMQFASIDGGSGANHPPNPT